MESFKLVLPEHLNHYGYLFGGNMLKWTDDVRACLGRKHTSRRLPAERSARRGRRSVAILHESPATQQCARRQPALRVETRIGVCGVAPLGQGMTMASAARLASIRSWPQREACFLPRQAHGIAASRDFPGCHFVTVGMDRVEFKQSVRQGAILRFVATQGEIGRSSVRYRVDVFSDDIERGAEEPVFATTVTFVCLNRQGEKMPLPRP